MRMRARSMPKGMAAGKAQSTMPRARRKPCSTTGRLRTTSTGFRNRFRKVTLFQALTQRCSASQSEIRWVVLAASTRMMGCSSTVYTSLPP